jgi:type I restriction enzyme S subunit
MSSEVAEHTLESLCLLVVDCPHATPKWTDDGVIVLRNQNIKGGRLDLSTPSFTDEEHYRGRTKRAVPTEGDIVITREAPMGDVCLIPPGLRCCVGQRQVLLRPDPKKVDSRFLLYALQSPYLQNQIGWNEGTGSTVSNLRIPVLEALKVPTPPLDAQRETAQTLGALDDRITLLREANATLEAIAQALFKSWFVDFDPVRAKMEGRAPEGMDEATAELFPDGLDESALGLVPKGWPVTSIADVSSVVKGKSYSSKDLVLEHDTALVTLKSFERGGGFRLDGFKPYSGTYKSTQVVVPGDLIIAYTDVTQAAELIGKPAIVVGVSAHKTLVASLDVGIVRPLESKVSRQFLYGVFKTDAFQAHTFSHTSGTTVLHLSKDGVGSYAFACPPFELVKAFSSVAEALAGRRQVNIDQMRNLATLRDTLLPRLISGQLRLPEAESQIEEATA